MQYTKSVEAFGPWALRQATQAGRCGSCPEAPSALVPVGPIKRPHARKPENALTGVAAVEDGMVNTPLHVGVAGSSPGKYLVSTKV